MLVIPVPKTIANSPELEADPSVRGVVDSFTLKAQPALSIGAEPLSVMSLPATDFGLNIVAEECPGT